MEQIIKRMRNYIKKWGKALKKLASNPLHPSLNTHEIKPLSRRYGMKVWYLYLEIKIACLKGELL